nr:sugar ABC transporter permease [Clostridia bacterium]
MDGVKSRSNNINRRGKKHRVRIGNIVLMIFLSLYALIQIYPLVWLILFSFKNNTEIFGGNVAGLPKVWRWSNYESAIRQANVLLYLRNSVIVTAATIFFVIMLASMAAFAIGRMKWKLSNTTYILIALGMMVPIHAALLPLFIVMKNLNLLNTFWALIIPYTAFGLPVAVSIFVSFMKSIPRELDEAAAIEGCNIYQIYYKVILPLLRPAIATVAIFTFISSWNELMFAITFINKKPFKTLPVGIMSMVGTYVTKWGEIGAGLVIATIPTIIVYLLLSDQVQKSIIAGAIKG